MKKLYVILFMFILMFSCAYAYNTTENLKYYYSFDTPLYLNNVIYIDELGNNNFTYYNTSNEISPFIKSVVGIKGNAVYSYGVYSDGVARQLRNSNLSLLNNKNITINYWFNINRTYGTFGGFYPQYKVSGLTNGYLIQGIYQKLIGNNYSINSVSNPNNNVWYMLTLQYFDNGMVKSYINGALWLQRNESLSNVLGIDGYYTLNSDNSQFDELSIWNTILSYEDIGVLYNFGDGLNYNQSVNGGISYNITNETITEVNYTNDSFHIGGNSFSYRQCINIGNGKDYVCNKTFYNTYNNGFYCDTDNIIWCGYGNKCMTFTYDVTTTSLYSYNLLSSCSQIESIGTTINLYCSAYWLANPLLINLLYSYMGYNCSTLNYYPISTSSCVNSDIHEIIDLFPDDTFYTEGDCVPVINNSVPQNCSSVCVLNSYSCLNNYTTAKCLLNNNTGCLYLHPETSCLLSEYCSNGNCISLYNQEVTIDENLSCIFFDCDNLKSNTKYLILLISTILILVIFVIIMSIFHEALAGVLVGLVLSMITSLTLTIIFRTTLLIPILYIIIGGAVFALLIKKVVYP